MAVMAVAVMSLESQSGVLARPSWASPPGWPTPSQGQTPIDADPLVSGLIVDAASSIPLDDEQAVDLLIDEGVEIFTSLGGGFHRLELGRSMSVSEAELISSRLVVNGAVRAAEPDMHRYVAGDPLVGDQWPLDDASGTAASGISVEEAWDVTVGSKDVVVAFIDTGTLPHPDLLPRLVAGYDMISSTFTANDGDGRDSDPLDEGDSCNARPSSWHGIHVAGIAGAETSNDVGISGVDQRSRLQPIRVLGVCGGLLSDEISAIRWAAGLPVVGTPTNRTPADVINLSLGGFGACGVAEQRAIDDAVSAGAVVVVAAGNSNVDLDVIEVAPTKCNNVIAVAAATSFGDRADYSNFGSIVDISAPGGLTLNAEQEGILSLSNAGTTAPDLRDTGWTYSYKQGTSMAAPHVSGVISLMLAANGQLSPVQIEQILKDTARPFPVSPRGTEFTCSSDPSAPYHCGAGLLDAGAAVRAAAEFATVPSEPGPVSVTTDARTATVSWSPPASNGGSEVTGYTATTSPGGRTCTWSSGPLDCAISGLEHGESYTVSVVARNQAGDSPPAVSSVFHLSPTFVPVPGTRLFDTRNGIGPIRTGLVTPDTPLTIPMTGLGPIPATGVGALALNVTATNATQAGFITVHNCDGPTPNVSALNYNANEAVANTVIIPPGTNGRICITTSTPTHLIADLTGWFPDNTGFIPVPGTRLFDTRNEIGPIRTGLVTPDTPLTIPMTGLGPIPATGVGALALNVTATNATQAGFITVHNCDGPTPNVSALNYNANEAVANTVIIPPGTNDRICITTSTPTHLIADLTGWFPDNTGFIPVPGTRLFDTRNEIGPIRTGLVTPDTPLTIPMTGLGPIPATGVGALALNVTATNATQAGFITVHNCDGPTPNVSALNYNANEAVANTVIIPPGTNGRICITTSTPTHLIADLTGWFPA